jgi:hypothetical protein
MAGGAKGAKAGRRAGDSTASLPAPLLPVSPDHLIGVVLTKRLEALSQICGRMMKAYNVFNTNLTSKT